MQFSPDDTFKDGNKLNRLGENPTAAKWFLRTSKERERVRQALQAGLGIAPEDEQFLPLEELLAVQGHPIIARQFAVPQAMMQQLEPAQPREQQETRRSLRRSRTKKRKWNRPKEDDIVVGTRSIVERAEMQVEVQRMGAHLFEMAERVLEQYSMGHRYPINDSRYKSIEVYPNGGDTIVVLLWAQHGQQDQSLTFDRQTGLMQIVDGATYETNHEPVPFAEIAERSEPEIGDLVVYRAMVPLIAVYLEEAKEDMEVSAFVPVDQTSVDSPAVATENAANFQVICEAGAALFADMLTFKDQYGLNQYIPIMHVKYTNIVVRYINHVWRLNFSDDAHELAIVCFDENTGFMKMDNIGQQSSTTFGPAPYLEESQLLLDQYLSNLFVPNLIALRRILRQLLPSDAETTHADVDGSDAPTSPDVAFSNEKHSQTATCRALALDLAASAEVALGDGFNRAIDIAAPSRFAGMRLCFSKGLSGVTVSIPSYGQVVLDREGAIVEVDEYDGRNSRWEMTDTESLKGLDLTMVLRVLRELNACSLINADPELAKTPVAQTVQALWEIASMAEGEGVPRFLPQRVGDFEVVHVEKYNVFHYVRVRDVRGARAILTAEFNTDTGWVGLSLDDEIHGFQSLDSIPFLAKAIGKEQVGCRDPQFDAYAAQLLTLVRSALGAKTVVASEGGGDLPGGSRSERIA